MVGDEDLIDRGEDRRLWLEDTGVAAATAKVKAVGVLWYQVVVEESNVATRAALELPLRSSYVNSWSMPQTAQYDGAAQLDASQSRKHAQHTSCGGVGLEQAVWGEIGRDNVIFTMPKSSNDTLAH